MVMTDLRVISKEMVVKIRRMLRSPREGVGWKEKRSSEGCSCFQEGGERVKQQWRGVRGGQMVRKMWREQCHQSQGGGSEERVDSVKHYRLRSRRAEKRPPDLAAKKPLVTLERVLISTE